MIRHTLGMILIPMVVGVFMVACENSTAAGPISPKFNQIIPACPSGFKEENNYSVDYPTSTGNKSHDESTAESFKIYGERSSHSRTCRKNDIELTMRITEYNSAAKAYEYQSQGWWQCPKGDRYPPNRYSSELIEDTPDNFCENFTYDYDYRILSKTEHYVTYTAGKFRVASQIYEYEEPWVTSINYNSPYTQILHQTADVINKKLRLIKD